MAIVAIVATRNMRRMFTSGDGAIVARAAGPQYLGVIHRRDRSPDICIVAVLADIRRLDMRQGLAGSSTAVMAADAISNDADVIEVRRPPCHSRMTVVADVTAGNMCRVFTDRDHAVMT